MYHISRHITERHPAAIRIWVCAILCAMILPVLSPTAYAQEPATTDEDPEGEPILDTQLLLEDPNLQATPIEGTDSVLVEVRAPGYSPEYGMKRPFSPDASRAVWLSALCPGLGQVYNRRYWKLPIIVAGFMGLGYGTSWNNNQYNDYANAYRDLMDSDPSTKSYMNFFPPTTSEEDLDPTWLASTLKSRKNYYRRNRELCIICMVGVYLLCMIDAYVDATMAHFDISPDLSLDIQPALYNVPGMPGKPAVGVQWALNF